MGPIARDDCMRSTLACEGKVEQINTMGQLVGSINLWLSTYPMTGMGLKVSHMGMVDH